MSETAIFCCIAIVALYFPLRSAFMIRPNWPASGPSCGACGQAYINEPICPKCGGSLTRTGMMTPRLQVLLGPGLARAAGCLLLMLACLCVVSLEVGSTIESRVLAPSQRIGFERDLIQLGLYHRIGFRNASDDGGHLARIKAPEVSFVVTVVQMYLQDTSTVRKEIPSNFRGEIMMIINKPGVYPYPRSHPTLFSFVPRFPHLRIDTGNQSVRVFDASGHQVAVYPTMDPRAWSDLIGVAALDQSDPFQQNAVRASESVYSSIASAMPDISQFGYWLDKEMYAVNGAFGLKRNGISIEMTYTTLNSLPPIPVAYIPVPHPVTTIWPILMVLGNTAAAGLALLWIHRRRRAIMEAGATEASAAAAS